MSPFVEWTLFQKRKKYIHPRHFAIASLKLNRKFFSTWSNKETEIKETRNILWPFLISPETHRLSIERRIESSYWNLGLFSRNGTQASAQNCFANKKVLKTERKNLRNKKNKEQNQTCHVVKFIVDLKAAILALFAKQTGDCWSKMAICLIWII